jgi:hypothetical protein
MIKRLAFLLLCCSPLLAADEVSIPDGDNASSNGTSCNSVVAASVDEDPADQVAWCMADSNNVSWDFRVTMSNPSGALDTTTDAQVIRYYVRSFDEGQGSDPDIRVDVYDTTTVACDTLHETGVTTSLTDAGFPNEVSDTWTAAGLSSGNDVCFDVVCTKTGGSPGNRNSCDIDAVVWDVTLAAATGRTRRMF